MEPHALISETFSCQQRRFGGDHTRAYNDGIVVDVQASPLDAANAWPRSQQWRYYIMLLKYYNIGGCI